MNTGKSSNRKMFEFSSLTFSYKNKLVMMKTINYTIQRASIKTLLIIKSLKYKLRINNYKWSSCPDTRCLFSRKAYINFSKEPLRLLNSFNFPHNLHNFFFHKNFLLAIINILQKEFAKLFHPFTRDVMTKAHRYSFLCMYI